MRTRDDEKQTALFQATVKLVNEIGFASSSVAKIARQAGVSPATIYIYFKNKEDLLVSTYIDIKQEMSRAVLDGFNPEMPIRDCLQHVWCNLFNYLSTYPDHHLFCVQFSNSPLVDLVDQAAVERYFEPVLTVMQHGIDQKVIKAVPFDMLAAFLFQPILFLSNNRACKDFVPDQANIELAFGLAWDAIKL